MAPTSARGAAATAAPHRAADGRNDLVAVVFGALAGSWTFRRKICSARPAAPHGHVRGTARFAATADPRWLQYAEQGTFTDRSCGGQRHAVTQRHGYHHDGVAAALVVTRGGRGGANELLHILHFLDGAPPPGPHDTGVWRAVAALACGADHYASRYRFTFVEGTLATFGVVHRVSGPRKAYRAVTTFARCPAGP